MSATSLHPGEIRFHQWCEPPLEAGSYRLTATQTSSQLEATDETAFTTELDFVVDAPRFALLPTDVYSVYPPKGQAGELGGHFPHIVLSRRTLPWERPLEPDHQRDENDTTPWLALLTLAAADFGGAFPELETRMVKALLKPEGAIAGPRDVQLAKHEDDKHLCTTIDIPVALFRAIAPVRKDLALLAHVREVNTGAKETAAYLGDGWHSVIVGNRLPRTEADKEIENRAYLVSLEGMAYALPSEPESLNGKEKVRLAVLSSWTFRCRDSQGFKAAVDRMRVGPLSVPWRDDAGSRSPPSEAEEHVERAFRMGYTAINHSTRLGEKTISWYRGPLIPVPPAMTLSDDFCPTADAALSYVSDDGMFDTSYAAAFQLGRLLALQSGHFAQSSQLFRRQMRSRINEVLERYRLRDTLGIETDVMKSDAGAMLRAFLGAAPAARNWNIAETRPIEAEENDKQLSLANGFDIKIPEALARWLARLVLLYRVPFVYLVPDQRMLERDKIRFFYLDHNWIKYLLEGACSVGRSTSRDELADDKLRKNFMKLALEQATTVRSDARSEAAASTRPAPKPPNWPITGFLMRSAIVEGWQGLEMHAWQDSGDHASEPLEPLRIDRLAPDILLCLFNGKIGRIEIKQPPEGLHFGLTRLSGGLGKLRLRDAAGAPVARQVTATMRNKSDNVLSVGAFAEEIRKALGLTSPLTSAEFAMQMIDLPGRVIFDINNPPDP